MFPNVSKIVFILIGLSFALASAQAADITPKMQKSLLAYKTKIVKWAADPVIVKAVKEANAKGPIPMMGNAKWREIAPKDPLIAGFETNPAGQLITKWMNEDPKGINKIVISGNRSHRVAFTSMPAIYIGKGKPNFDEAFAGKVWQQPESKPDPSTQIDSVQIAAPIKDGVEVIGVLLVSLTAANL